MFSMLFLFIEKLQQGKFSCRVKYDQETPQFQVAPLNYNQNESFCGNFCMIFESTENWENEESPYL